MAGLEAVTGRGFTGLDEIVSETPDPTGGLDLAGWPDLADWIKE